MTPTGYAILAYATALALFLSYAAHLWRTACVLSRRERRREVPPR